MFSRRWWSFCTLSFCLRIFAFWVGSPFFKFSYLRESFRCSRLNCFSSFLIRAVLLIFLFQPYPSKRRNLNPVSFAKTVFGIISYKIHFYIRSSFFLIPRKTTLMMKKSWKSCTGIFNRMFYRFGTDFPDPGIFLMVRKIVIIQPYAERFTAHKFFTQSIKFFSMKQVKIIDISACADCLMYFNLLLFCRIDLCFETF